MFKMRDPGLDSFHLVLGALLTLLQILSTKGRDVGIQDHAVAGIEGHAVAEAPTGVARALLYCTIGYRKWCTAAPQPHQNQNTCEFQKTTKPQHKKMIT